MVVESSVEVARGDPGVIGCEKGPKAGQVDQVDREVAGDALCGRAIVGAQILERRDNDPAQSFEELHSDLLIRCVW